MPDHVVHFYEPEGSGFAACIARFLAGALCDGDVALVVAPVERLNAVHDALEARGIDCREAVKRGRLELLEAHETLDCFMYAGRPDPVPFDRIVGDKVRELLSRRQARALHVYGEMVGILWSDGNDMGAVELELLWNKLIADLPVKLYCGYPLDGFDDAEPTGTAKSVLAAHTRIVPEYLAARTA